MPEEKTVLVECMSDKRKAVGIIVFENRDGYEFPVAEMPESQAKRIIKADDEAQAYAEKRNAERTAQLGNSKKPIPTITQKHFRYAVKLEGTGRPGRKKVEVG